MIFLRVISFRVCVCVCFFFFFLEFWILFWRNGVASLLYIYDLVDCISRHVFFIYRQGDLHVASSFHTEPNSIRNIDTLFSVQKAELCVACCLSPAMWCILTVWARHVPLKWHLFIYTLYSSVLWDLPTRCNLEVKTMLRNHLSDICRVT